METTRFKRLRVLRPALFAAAVAVLTQFVYADSEYADAWGPSAGSKAPMLSALDQDGNQQNLTSLSSANGLLFVFNRSVDW
jgi:hypothetical protein